MGKASGIAWVALGAEVLMGLIIFLSNAGGSGTNFGIIPLVVAISALVAVVITATEW